VIARPEALHGAEGQLVGLAWLDGADDKKVGLGADGAERFL